MLRCGHARLARLHARLCANVSHFHSAKPAIVLESQGTVVASLPVTPFAMNQYLIGCRATGEAAFIDAGDDNPQRWKELSAELGLTVRHILLTHAHVDHVAGLAATKEAFPDASIHLHPDDWLILKSSPQQGMAFGFSIDRPPAADEELSDGQIVCVGSLELQALHTPGHAPGHVCFHESNHGLLFSGDLLFKNSIGRTDFPGCDAAAMQRSLRRILSLPPELHVFPGHMEQTTLADEAANNPFLLGLSE
jgi:hydroxyacylglutathione hydrolase